jgi:hypothetical protein
MALKVSSIPSLPRVNSGVARMLPIATTLLAAIIAILPVPVPGYAALTPAFTLMAVYHWTIYRPICCRRSGFAIGLAQDLLVARRLVSARWCCCRSRRGTALDAISSTGPSVDRLALAGAAAMSPCGHCIALSS